MTAVGYYDWWEARSNEGRLRGSQGGSPIDSNEFRKPRFNERQFREWLRKKGKKPHVVDQLNLSVKRFQQYLLENGGIELHEADRSDLQRFADAVEAQARGSARKLIRGIALYYEMCGNQPLASTARAIRESGAAQRRRPFKLKGFRGVDPEHLLKLAGAGISDVDQMIVAGGTPMQREALAQEYNIPLSTILDLVKLSDLSRIGGLKGIRARLYVDAGVDTIDKLASWEPEALRSMLVEFVRRTRFEGIAPLPKEVQNAVTTARKLPRLVAF